MVEGRCEIKGKMGSVLGDVYAGRLSGMEKELICSFKLTAVTIRSGV